MDHIKKYISKAFEVLSAGHFISANSSRTEIKRLYEVIEEYFEDFYNYFEPLNFFLGRGNNYFYFSREQQRQTVEQKVERFYRYIDYLAFFRVYDNLFSEGTRFTLGDLEQRCKANTDLMEILKRMNLEKETVRDRVQKIVEQMTRESFFECENPETQSYKVLSAYNYFEEIIEMLDIDQTDEQ
ncbi:condensin complex protein MksE [Algivirga pacifica]|uniref:DUF4194 domain-containing protein n=1 Tax=Algivirga pacifica TaxID=1162670 RepID=A0ABP9DK18_9BACT